MDKAAMPEGKYLASVKLGPKGQIVVPKEVREMFGIRPGDTLLLLADVNRGIALQTFERRIRSSVMSFRTGSNKSAAPSGAALFISS